MWSFKKEARVDGQDISNRRTVFEQMILSLLRVLYTLENIEDIRQFLAEVLDKESSLLVLRKKKFVHIFTTELSRKSEKDS